jgi:hypothetical protein
MYTYILPQVVGVGGSASTVVGELWDNEDLSRLHMLIVNTDVQASGTKPVWQAHRSMPQQQQLHQLWVLLGDAHMHMLGSLAKSGQQLQELQTPTTACILCCASSHLTVVLLGWSLSCADWFVVST